MNRSELKVGLNRGAGAPPGYLWNVWILPQAIKEGRNSFNEAQYDHIVDQFRELGRENDPSHSNASDIDAVEEFFELRDRGGVLGAINARIFFGVYKERRAIVILGAIGKQNNGPTPPGDKIVMRRRWRKFKNGDYGFPSEIAT